VGAGVGVGVGVDVVPVLPAASDVPVVLVLVLVLVPEPGTGTTSTGTGELVEAAVADPPIACMGSQTMTVAAQKAHSSPMTLRRRMVRTTP
jgi:hypothetical protein